MWQDGQRHRLNGAGEANGMTIGTQTGRVEKILAWRRERGVKFPHVFYTERYETRCNPAPNLPILMERLPIQSDRQSLLIAYSDMPFSKRCRLGPPNPHPKIMKFRNQLGDFLNALKQSLFTTTTTHKRHLTKPEVQCAANTMH
jgi:hypothetical protein